MFSRGLIWAGRHTLLSHTYSLETLGTLMDPIFSCLNQSSVIESLQYLLYQYSFSVIMYYIKYGNFMFTCKNNDFQKIMKLFRSTVGLGRLMGLIALSYIKLWWHNRNVFLLLVLSWPLALFFFWWWTMTSQCMEEQIILFSSQFDFSWNLLNLKERMWLEFDLAK